MKKIDPGNERKYEKSTQIIAMNPDYNDKNSKFYYNTKEETKIDNENLRSKSELKSELKDPDKIDSRSKSEIKSESDLLVFSSMKVKIEKLSNNIINFYLFERIFLKNTVSLKNQNQKNFQRSLKSKLNSQQIS